MKVILAMVLSVDGRSTKGDKAPKNWASKEDQKFFFNLMRENKLIVMGSGALERDPVKPVPGKLKIILTRDPKKYQKYQIAGQLEFTNENPSALVKRLSKLGFNQMLLVSGETLNSQFFKDKLIAELWITLEPKIFGKGRGIVKAENFDINLKLISTIKLNSRGTLLLKYNVN